MANCRKKLDVRQKRAIKGILEGKSQTKAFRDAGYSKTTAAKKSGAMLKSLAPTFTDLLDKGGLSDPALVKKINFLFDAKETKFFQKDGIVTDEREVEALGIQANMVEFVAKLKGHVRDKLDLTVTDGLAVRINEARERRRAKVCAQKG